MRKLKIFTGKIDVEGNKVRICPSCKKTMFYNDVSHNHPLDETEWNNEILAIMCCNCIFWLESYLENTKLYDSMIKAQRIKRYDNYDSRNVQCRLLRSDLGLRKLELIKNK